MPSSARTHNEATTLLRRLGAHSRRRQSRRRPRVALPRGRALAERHRRTSTPPSPATSRCWPTSTRRAALALQAIARPPGGARGQVRRRCRRQPRARARARRGSPARSAPKIGNRLARLYEQHLEDKPEGAIRAPRRRPQAQTSRTSTPSPASATSARRWSSGTASPSSWPSASRSRATKKKSSQMKALKPGDWASSADKLESRRRGARDAHRARRSGRSPALRARRLRRPRRSPRVEGSSSRPSSSSGGSGHAQPGSGAHHGACAALFDRFVDVGRHQDRDARRSSRSMRAREGRRPRARDQKLERAVAVKTNDHDALSRSRRISCFQKDLRQRASSGPRSSCAKPRSRRGRGCRPRAPRRSRTANRRPPRNVPAADAEKLLPSSLAVIADKSGDGSSTSTNGRSRAARSARRDRGCAPSRARPRIAVAHVASSDLARISRAAPSPARPPDETLRRCSKKELARLRGRPHLLAARSSVDALLPSAEPVAARRSRRRQDARGPPAPRPRRSPTSRSRTPTRRSPGWAMPSSRSSTPPSSTPSRRWLAAWETSRAPRPPSPMRSPRCSTAPLVRQPPLAARQAPSWRARRQAWGRRRPQEAPRPVAHRGLGHGRAFFTPDRAG